MLLDHPSDGLTAIRTHIGAIFVSLELSRSNWLVTSLSPGKGEKMSKHSITAGDIAGLLALFAELKRKAAIRTGQSYPIITLQEAGLDGFWLHRVLQQEGIESHVVDPASIATPRRRRRAKTDRLDGEALLRALLAYKRGEPRVCAMVVAPSPEEEDRRRLCRELDRIELLLGQIKAVEAAQDALLAAARKPASEEAAPDPVTMLLALRGVGANFAAVLWSEAFYRQFANRRQVAAYAGLAATPWQSGGIRHEQGVSKAGNPRLRTTMIQLAWLWIRHQPQSALTRWFKERSQQGRKRAIVALARKLLVALWKYVTQGVVIEGAVMKPAA